MRTLVSLFNTRFFWLILIIPIMGCEFKKTGQINEADFKQFLKQRDFEASEYVSQASDFHYQLLNGQSENLRANQNNLVLLNFWATWCYPCKQEMPDLEELKHRMKGERFRILAVNSGDASSKVLSFINKYPYSFDIVLDEKREISNLFNVVGLPTTFILDRNLKVVGKVVGPINWKDDIFIEKLKEYSRI